MPHTHIVDKKTRATVPVFIQSVSAITVQDSFPQGLHLDKLVTPRDAYCRCLDPDFKKMLSPLVARRMSNVIKRAVVTSRQALDASEINIPEAIIVGTGLGCIEETEKFLDAMICNDEQGLQPVHFFQSTHNTIASQIAISLQCHGFNNTHVQKSLSFESALFEAYILFQRSRISSALVAGHDEMTPAYFELLRKINHFADAFAGEGSAAAVLSNARTSQTMAELKDMSMCYMPENLAKNVCDFLEKNNTSFDEIDFLFSTGNPPHFLAEQWDAECVVNTETFSGRYFSSGGFALCLAAECIRAQRAKQILLYNQSEETNHALVLLTA